MHVYIYIYGLFVPLKAKVVLLFKGPEAFRIAMTELNATESIELVGGPGLCYQRCFHQFQPSMNPWLFVTQRTRKWHPEIFDLC